VVAVLAAVTLLWLQARPWATRTVNTPARLGAAAAWTGLAGTVLWALSLVLAARVRLLEALAGGLDRVYRLHHRIGALAFAMVAAHPSLLAWRYGRASWDRAAELWWPSSTVEVLAGQVALAAMVVAIVITFYVHVRHQVFVWVQRMLGVAFVPAAYHVLYVGGDVTEDRTLRTAVQAIVVLGLVALVARTLLGRVVGRHATYEIVAAVPRLGSITELHLRPRGRSLAFVPGQFAFVRIGDDALGGEPHPFSMASAPTSTELRFAVKDLGDYTHRLSEVRLGATAVVEGPFGRFSHRYVKGRRQLWIGGGIGIAPFLSMASTIPGSPYDVDLVYAFGDRARAPYLDELDALAAVAPNLRVHHLEERVDGLPTVPAIVAMVGSLDDREVLLCGPPAMMHALHDALRSAGVPRSRIHFEEFAL
jgi:predicted ferric reductase